MANREKGEVSFEYEGQTYTLVLNTNALVKLQGLFNTKDATGHDEIANVLEIDRLVKAGSLVHIRGLFWAALQKYHSHVAPTPDAAGDFLDTVGAEATAALLAVSGFGHPDPKDLEELARGNPPTAQAAAKKRGRGASSISKRVKAA